MCSLCSIGKKLKVQSCIDGLDAACDCPVAAGVNFINILQAAFVAVDLRRSYWCTLQSIQHKSGFLVVRTSKAGRIFVGETERHRRMTTSTFALCATRLVKLSLCVNFINVIQAAFAPVG